MGIVIILAVCAGVYWVSITMGGGKSGHVSGQLLVETKDLTKHYGELVAVDKLNLRVERGTIFGLLGPNGAGKTTTILMLLGLTEPTAGKALINGLDPTRNPLQVKSIVGYLPDNVGFYQDMTGEANLRYTCELNGLSPGKRKTYYVRTGRVGLKMTPTAK